MVALADTYPHNPKADYFRNCGGCGVKQRIDLSGAGINEGDILHILATGSVEWSCAGGCCVEAVIAAFTDVDAACPGSGDRLQAKYPDGSNVPAYPDPNGWFDDKDFNVRDDSCGYANDIYVEVPAGAEYLFLGVPDGYVCDNTTTTPCSGIAVTVTVVGDIYVDAAATGADSGKSWNDAYTDLQDALAEACARECVEQIVINVAEGTYRPDVADPGNRNLRFDVCENTKVYGSWWNSIGIVWIRDMEYHPTILSGDLDDDDGDAPTSGGECAGYWESGPSTCWDNEDKNVEIGKIKDNTEGLIHVQSGSEDSVLLDGLIVEGGYAQTSPSYGGGLCSLDASPTISDCIFRSNYSGGGSGLNGGAAMHIAADDDDDVSPIISNCKFEENVAGVSSNMTWARLARAAVSLSGDEGSDDGIFAGSVTGCTFTGNHGYRGGAIHFNEPVGATVSDCEFNDNASSSRGGAIDWSGSGDHSVEITDCYFAGNTVKYDQACTSNQFSSENVHGGGALMVSSISTLGAPSLTLGNCTFEGNMQLDDTYDCASTGGGAVALEHTNAVIYNCLFFDNDADGNGGGIFIFGDEDYEAYPHRSDVQLTNCTFSDNHSADLGGGVFVNGNGVDGKSSDAKVVGCILYYNSADNGDYVDREQIHFDGYTSIDLDDPQTDPIYSCIQCDKGTQADCVGDAASVICYDTDTPEFSNRAMDDYTLSDSSLCIDKACQYPSCGDGYNLGAMGNADLAAADRLTDGELDGEECADNGEDIDIGCYEHEECVDP